MKNNNKKKSTNKLPIILLIIIILIVGIFLFKKGNINIVNIADNNNQKEESFDTLRYIIPEGYEADKQNSTTEKGKTLLDQTSYYKQYHLSEEGKYLCDIRIESYTFEREKENTESYALDMLEKNFSSLESFVVNYTFITLNDDIDDIYRNPRKYLENETINNKDWYSFKLNSTKTYVYYAGKQENDYNYVIELNPIQESDNKICEKTFNEFKSSLKIDI